MAVPLDRESNETDEPVEGGIAGFRASTHYVSPFLGMIYGVDAPVSGIRTQHLLGWAPNHEGLLRDLEHGDHLSGPVA